MSEINTKLLFNIKILIVESLLGIMPSQGAS